MLFPRVVSAVFYELEYIKVEHGHKGGHNNYNSNTYKSRVKLVNVRESQAVSLQPQPVSQCQDEENRLRLTSAGNLVGFNLFCLGTNRFEALAEKMKVVDETVHTESNDMDNSVDKDGCKRMKAYTIGDVKDHMKNYTIECNNLNGAKLESKKIRGRRVRPIVNKQQG